ncbi:hypothetical protein BLNAU_22748 [Blattamonas nauphoetae]|uniref:C2HC/C3H-type domain-containing protein n=1 Tax=Blattamonas nauphoetae TaxID=2049346 RepID=A0ABQ9WS97_9EUKA|nr:hypothetical protein BLNAU_22748 [Blattamonas nauphoetae]
MSDPNGEPPAKKPTKSKFSASKSKPSQDKKKIEKDTSTTDNSKPESKTSINNEDKSELKKDTSQAPVTKRESSVSPKPNGKAPSTDSSESKTPKERVSSSPSPQPQPEKEKKTKKETAKQKTPEEPKIEPKSPPEKEKPTPQPSEQTIPSKTETEPPKDDPPPSQNEATPATEEDKPKAEKAEEKPVNIEDQPIIIGHLQNMTFEEMIELKLKEDEERAKNEGKDGTMSATKKTSKETASSNTTPTSAKTTPPKAKNETPASATTSPDTSILLPTPDGEVELVKCAYCPRTFAKDRLEKHQVICKKRYEDEQWKKKNEELARKKEEKEKLEMTKTNRSPIKTGSTLLSPIKGRGGLNETKKEEEKTESVQDLVRRLKAEREAEEDDHQRSRGFNATAKNRSLSPSDEEALLMDNSAPLELPPIDFSSEKDESRLRDTIALRLQLLNMMDTQTAQPMTKMDTFEETLKKEQEILRKSVDNSPPQAKGGVPKSKVLRRPKTSGKVSVEPEKPKEPSPPRISRKASAHNPSTATHTKISPVKEPPAKGKVMSGIPKAKHRSTSPLNSLAHSSSTNALPRESSAKRKSEPKKCGKCKRELCCGDAAYCCRCGAKV